MAAMPPAVKPAVALSRKPIAFPWAVARADSLPMKVSNKPRRAVVYTACRKRPADKPVYKSRTLPLATICRATANGLVLGPDAVPSPASWIRTLTMSTGCMTVVATMPLMPPLMKGSAALMSGVWRMSLATVTPSPFAAFMTSEVLFRADSAACFKLPEVIFTSGTIEYHSGLENNGCVSSKRSRASQLLVGTHSCTSTAELMTILMLASYPHFHERR